MEKQVKRKPLCATCRYAVLVLSFDYKVVYICTKKDSGKTGSTPERAVYTCEHYRKGKVSVL